MYMSGAMEAHMITAESGAGILSVYNCGLVNSMTPTLSLKTGITVMNHTGSTNLHLVNNLIHHTTDDSVPISGAGPGTMTYNWYDLPTAGYSKFNGGNTWAIYTGAGNEPFSMTGESKLGGGWYLAMKGQMTTGSNLIGIGTNLMSTLKDPYDIVGISREPTGAWDIGPYIYSRPRLTRYKEGSYGRHGFAPS
jgi:hypothetical protein